MAPDFDKTDLEGFRAAKELDRLDSYQGGLQAAFSKSDGWKETSVKIHLPADGVAHPSEASAPEFEIPGLFYRKPLEVIKSALREVSAEKFHITPFTMLQKSMEPDAPPERIYSEIYNSDAMIEEHDKVRSQSHASGCNLETVIVAVMLWSDSTHLASFRTASIWPIYMYLGNLSKYARGKPTSFAAHHLAYIPKVSPGTMREHD